MSETSEFAWAASVVPVIAALVGAAGGFLLENKRARKAAAKLDRKANSAAVLSILRKVLDHDEWARSFLVACREKRKNFKESGKEPLEVIYPLKAEFVAPPTPIELTNSEFALLLKTGDSGLADKVRRACLRSQDILELFKQMQRREDALNRFILENAVTQAPHAAGIYKVGFPTEHAAKAQILSKQLDAALAELIKRLSEEIPKTKELIARITSAARALSSDFLFQVTIPDN